MIQAGLMFRQRFWYWPNIDPVLSLWLMLSGINMQGRHYII